MAANWSGSVLRARRNDRPKLFRTLCLTIFVGLITTVPVMGVTVVDMLDDFDVEQYVYTPAGFNALAADAVAGSMVGGFRGAFVQKTSGSSSQFLRVEALDDTTDGASAFSVSRSSMIGGVALVQWDGDNMPPNSFDPVANLDTSAFMVDLESGGAAGIVIRMLAADIAGQELTIDLFGLGANPNSVARAQQTVVLPAIGSAVDILFPWANFTEVGVGTLDLANVGAITLSITGPIGSDLTMDYIATYVPEPTSVSILTMGAAALITHNLRKRRRAVTEVGASS